MVSAELVLAGLAATFMASYASLHLALGVPAVIQDDERLTIRVNTFRRNDLLQGFLEYYTHTKRAKECALIEEITVIWSDTDSAPPADWETLYGPRPVLSEEEQEQAQKKAAETGATAVRYTTSPDGPRVRFEIHPKNSLNNRFLPLQPPPTEAVLSLDDDLIVPCSELARSLRVWSSFPRALVGYSPRMHALDSVSGDTRYLRWQHTWWSGLYSIVLTKGALLHRDHLAAFKRMVPASFLEHVDAVRNCEDLALAHVVAQQTQAPPVWVSGIVYEVSAQNVGGISSGGSHFDTRSQCLSELRTALGDFPWEVGRQKAQPLALADMWW